MAFADFARLEEKLITIGGGRPKYDQVVIIAGGAGSGKGFVIGNLLGIEGKHFDVDFLKELALKSKGIKATVKKEYGIDFDDLNLKNPEDVSTLHQVVDDMHLSKIKRQNLISHVAAHNKPNLIFDVTMKDVSKLINISSMAQDAGYKKENIHIIWVINDVETAKKQNRERGRRVKEDILIDTHEMVSYTMSNIMKDHSKMNKYMDGDFWVVFNKQYVDSAMALTPDEQKAGAGGNYIKDVLYFRLKKKGKSLFNNLADRFVDKIKKYVPNPKVWDE